MQALIQIRGIMDNMIKTYHSKIDSNKKTPTEIVHIRR